MPGAMPGFCVLCKNPPANRWICLNRLFVGLGGFLFGFFLGLCDLVAELSLEGGSLLSASLEAIDATFGIDDLLFASEEWVRCARNLNLN